MPKRRCVEIFTGLKGTHAKTSMVSKCLCQNARCRNKLKSLIIEGPCKIRTLLNKTHYSLQVYIISKGCISNRRLKLLNFAWPTMHGFEFCPRALTLPPPSCSGQLSTDAHVRLCACATLKSSRHHPHQTKGTKPILLPEIGQEMPADDGGAKWLVRT